MIRSESKDKRTVHGGRVYAAARKWGIDPGDVVDFSANINPDGPPQAVLAALIDSIKSIRSYPDLSVLIEALSDRLGVPRDCITVGNGSTALIFAAVRALCPRNALLLEPAFAEYGRALQTMGTHIDSVVLSPDNNFLPDWDILNRELQTAARDLIIINNPHNPSGALINREDLLRFARHAKSNGTAVIIDEAFIDYVPESSTLPLIVELDNTIVLRSLTKFYSIPGLRIGYAVCHPDIALRLQAQTETWPVSAPAIDAAMASLSDNDFDELARNRNLASRNEFATHLSELPDVKVFPSSANFLLIKLENRDCRLLAEWLEQFHILIRLCDSFEGLNSEYARLAMLKPEHNMKLVNLIGQWLIKQNE